MRKVYITKNGTEKGEQSVRSPDAITQQKKKKWEECLQLNYKMANSKLLK